MAQVLVNEASLQDIAAAIREKNGTEKIYLPSEMAPAIMALEVVPPKSWFGDGRDGDLVVADGATLALDVSLDDGQIVKRYANGSIGTGALLTAANRCCGMVLCFTGDLDIYGTISMNKLAPLKSDMEETHAKEEHVALCGGLIGGNSGMAGNSGSDTSNFNGSGSAGQGFAFGGGYGPGSASNYGSASVGVYGGNGEPRPPIGTSMPYYDTTRTQGQRALYGAGGGHPNQTLYGGRGPGGSGACYSYYAGQSKSANGNDGDAYGGGAIFLFVGGRLTIHGGGAVTANGGNGAAGAGTRAYYGPYDTDVSGGGGGGGGGIVAIVHNGDYTNGGSVTANGGNGGAKHSYGGTAGTNGEAGTVLITTIAELLANA